MKKDTFIRGMFSAYVAIVITKILGMLYSIPFYGIIGKQGGVIYACVYNVYALFLDIATCGIPVAVSIVISEYHTKHMPRSERRAYQTAMQIILSLSLLSFAVMQFFADGLAQNFLKDMEHGVSPASVANGIRIVSLCMLIVPFLSVRRGLLQGYKYVTVSSKSQVIEQLVRIAVSLIGSYVVIRLLKQDVELGVDMAFAGTVLGALLTLLYVNICSRGTMKEVRSAAAAASDNLPRAQIIGRLVKISIPILIVSLTYSIYSVVDMKLILVGLHSLQFSDPDTQEIASVASTWAPRICMIITALPMGIVSSIAPFMAESNTASQPKAVAARLNQALGVLLLISVPLGAGMMLLAEPMYRLFYGSSVFGGGILALLVVVNVIGGISSVLSTTMQSVGRGKAVSVTILVGIVLNAMLDLPIIYLFHQIGIPAYLGAATASIIGQCVTVFLQLRSLRKSHGYRFTTVLHHTLRIAAATAVMLLAVFLLKLLWPVMEQGRGLLVLQLLVYALVGGGIYFLLIYLANTAESILGNAAYERVLDRFRIRKLMDRLLFFPALWAGKLLLFIYQHTGHERNDKPGMAALRLCGDFLKYAAKPKLTIVVSGTNGKTSISCMVADILRQRGLSVSYTDWGANDRGGNAWCILNAVSIFNRPTKDAAVIEMDELVSRRNVPQLKPNYLIVNNLARDSMLRNATPEFVESHLHSAAESSPNTVVISNADDPLSCGIGEKNRRVYFGAADLHTNPSAASLHDLALCPHCFGKLDYAYRNFRHIGRFSCPSCGNSAPKSDCFVERVDPARRLMTVRSGDGSHEYPLISSSIYNIYNEAAIIAMFLDMGLVPEELGGYLAKASIPASRATKTEANGIAIYTQMAKGQNATATSSVFEAVAKEPGEKELIILVDEVYDHPGESETAAWIFDVQYEYLVDPHIRKIIVGGDRYLDHRVRMLMAGIPPEKTVCIQSMTETAELVDTEGIDSIYILHDVNFVSRARAVRDAVQKRIEAAGRKSQ
ncbi:MAG: DUF1727 domain-containing protein [Oscillospiraceae bacterium]|nr:DUF1727 domain-containing protein [Oscillospiraceae bacterium]